MGAVDKLWITGRRTDKKSAPREGGRQFTGTWGFSAWGTRVKTEVRRRWVNVGHPEFPAPARRGRSSIDGGRQPDHVIAGARLCGIEERVDEPPGVVEHARRAGDASRA